MYAATRRNASAADQQHSKSHVCPSAEHHPYGRDEDSNGILFVRFPIMELAAALSRSPVTVKRSLKELEDIGLILRVRRGVGEPNRIYTLLPKGGLP